MQLGLGCGQKPTGLGRVGNHPLLSRSTDHVRGAGHPGLCLQRSRTSSAKQSSFCVSHAPSLNNISLYRGIMLYLQLHDGELTPPITAMENYFRLAGVTIIQAAFTHSYFIHPDTVREKTPFFPERARFSRQHYPGLGKGQKAVWSGDDREILLDDNQHAQLAWSRYTGHGLARGTGYSIRHIWGHPWDPDAFTAGWNLCYMPFWAGMLTERQHPHEELERAIRQASWDLYFRNNRVCRPPDFVEDPGIDLSSLLAGQPLLILQRNTPVQNREAEPAATKRSRDRPRTGRRSADETILPIELDPADSQVFLDALLRTKEAWIEVSYQDGHREVQRWNAARMSPSSNVIRNLRSRSEFRAGEWQRRSITSVRVRLTP